MIAQEIRVMRGPNMWSNSHPHIIAVRIKNENYSHQDIKKITEWLRSSVNLSTENIFLNHIPCAFIAVVVSELAKYMQPDAERLYSDIRLMGKEAYYALTSYEEEDAGVAAVKSACSMLDAVLKSEIPEDFVSAMERIKKSYAANFLGPSTSAIVKAAVRRNIPYRLGPGGYIIFGQGAYQKKIAASISDQTSDISVDIAGDKEITKQILYEALLPVPKGVVISKEESISAVLAEIEFPVVVKPLNANQGKGITGNITNEEGLRTAFKFAKEFSNSVIIEKHIAGNDYRFLVIGNKLTAVAHRVPAHVIGNGKQNIQQLIESVNADPLRAKGHAGTLTKIVIDENTLKLLSFKNLTLESIPEKDMCVFLKDTANLSTGGTAIDVTDEVHPDNVLMAERVASIIGLDICGIDVMAPDVKTPITSNGGAILEVNAAPGLRMHAAPSLGKPRNVGDPIINLLYPEGAKTRLPIVAITGTNGKTTTSRLMAHLASYQNYYVGYTTTDGIYLNDRLIFKGDCTGPKSAKLILQEPLVNFAVLECARGGIIRSGLAFDQCDIGIVTNVAADHLGLKDIYTIEDLAQVKSVIPKSVSLNGYAILNAGDDLVYSMREGLSCNIALFSIDGQNPRILNHCEGGGYAIVMDEKKDIVIIKGNDRIIVCNVMDIPLSMQGKAEFMIENVLPVTLASYLLGFDMRKIKAGLEEFKPSLEQTPGRLNMFEINGIHVILDYAHNPHGIQALGKYLNNLEVEITGIITGVGDRRDDDIVEIGRLAANIYDKVVIRSDLDTRGRSSEEIASLIGRGIQEVNPELPYSIIPDSRSALLYAIENSVRGSYIVLSADDAVDTIGMINEIRESFQVPSVK